MHGAPAEQMQVDVEYSLAAIGITVHYRPVALLIKAFLPGNSRRREQHLSGQVHIAIIKIIKG